MRLVKFSKEDQTHLQYPETHGIVNTSVSEGKSVMSHGIFAVCVLRQRTEGSTDLAPRGFGVYRP